MGVWAAVIGMAAELMRSGTALRRAGRLPVRTPRRQVAFTIAAIALAAKMARADGVASASEFAAFERLFQVSDAERANAARFYVLAKRSTAGFEAYADQAAGLLGAGSPILEDLLEALLLIAKLDGFETSELDYLEAVATRFGFDTAAYARIKARHVAAGPGDPWRVLGVALGADLAEVRAAYRTLVKTYHPDKHMADGTPVEFIRVAEDRMAAINAAYAILARPGPRT